MIHGPNEAYGWEKLFTEEMAKAYQEDYGLDTRIARYHNIYGPRGKYKVGCEKPRQPCVEKRPKYLIPAL